MRPYSAQPYLGFFLVFFCNLLVLFGFTLFGVGMELVGEIYAFVSSKVFLSLVFLVLPQELYQTQGCLLHNGKKHVRPKAVMYHKNFLKREERWEWQFFRKYISRIKILHCSLTL